MRTRTKAAARSAEFIEPPTSVPKIQLGPESSNPPRLFVFPQDITPEARVISLTNPRYATSDRYVICPERGIHEFIKVAAPRTSPRSWLLTPEDSRDGCMAVQDDLKVETGTGSPIGFVSRDADLFIATAIDPLFFVLPALDPVSKSAGPTKRLFLSMDDYLERITTISPQISGFLHMKSLRDALECRLTSVCETVEAGDENMYRLSSEKLLNELLHIARRMVERGLPESMEEKFVKKALEAPMLSIKRDDSSIQERAYSGEVSPVDSAETPDTQTTAASVTSSFSEASTAPTSFSEELSTVTSIEPIEQTVTASSAAPEGVTDLLRLRTALFFLCSNYIPPHIAQELKKILLCSTSPIDFVTLDTHLAQLVKLRRDAASSRSISDYSRKRGIDVDDETAELRAEKKRKKDEEDQRKKAGMSLGVKKLQKVNTSGMKKMSEFFKRK